jgi:long-chain fatty acid transport protein
MTVLSPLVTGGDHSARGGVPARRAMLPALVLGVIAFGLFPSDSLGVDGVEPVDASTQAKARGGADVAIGDSAISQIEGPASLANWRTIRFDLAGQVIFPRVHWQGPIDSSYSGVGAVPLGNLGLAVPINDRLTFGIAFNAKSGLATRYHIRHLLIPYVKRRVGSDVKDMGLSFNLGYRVNDQLAIGGGVRTEMMTTEFSTVFGPADLDFGRGCAWGGGFQVGMLYKATKDLNFGLAYRSPTWFRDLKGGGARASLFGVLPLHLGQAIMDDPRLPQRITGGVAWDATDWLKLVGEVRWINYENSSFNSVEIIADGFVNKRINLPLGYRDQWVFIAGAEFKLDDHWTVGLGYNYATNPTRRGHLLPIGSSLLQHHITAGLRYEQDDWWVGGGYIIGLRSHLSGDGTSAYPLGIDYGFSSVDQTQHSVFFGFGFSFGE